MEHSQSNPRLSLGPVQYLWSRDDLFALYDEVAETAIDIVYLGETVCSKRRSLRLDDWIEVGERPAAAGKEVVLSSRPVSRPNSSPMGVFHWRCRRAASPHVRIIYPRTTVSCAVSTTQMACRSRPRKARDSSH